MSTGKHGELRTIPDQATGRADPGFFQFQNHEGGISTVLVPKSPLVGMAEAESLIIIRLTQYDHVAEAGVFASREALANESSTDPSALEIWANRERCQSDAGSRADRSIDLDRAERDMTDDLVIELGHERDLEITCATEKVDESRLGSGGKGGFDESSDRDGVGRVFRSDRQDHKCDLNEDIERESQTSFGGTDSPQVE